MKMTFNSKTHKVELEYENKDEMAEILTFAAAHVSYQDKEEPTTNFRDVATYWDKLDRSTPPALSTPSDTWPPLLTSFDKTNTTINQTATNKSVR